MNRLCESRNGKNASKIFENSFLQNAILEFRSDALFVTFFSNSYDLYKNHNNEILRKITKIVIYVFP